MLQTNKDKLVMQSVTGKVHNPTFLSVSTRVLVTDGSPFNLPSVGGICYNVKIGDSVYGLAGDHIEPGASIRNPDAAENGALNFLSCVGNVARVISGDAKGREGYITGKHGGIEHCLAYFDDATLDKLVPGDSILVKSCGQGLKLLDYPDIFVKNCSPELLEKLNITEKDGKLLVGVTAVIPAFLMGAGMGSSTSVTGDYDLMTADKQALEKYKLNNLRFGDIVYLQDCDNVYGRGYLEGAATIGVIVHSDCLVTGHGPGVTTLLTCKTAKLEPVIDVNANIGNMLGILK